MKSTIVKISVVLILLLSARTTFSQVPAAIPLHVARGLRACQVATGITLFEVMGLDNGNGMDTKVTPSISDYSSEFKVKIIELRRALNRLQTADSVEECIWFYQETKQLLDEICQMSEMECDSKLLYPSIDFEETTRRAQQAGYINWYGYNMNLEPCFDADPKCQFLAPCLTEAPYTIINQNSDLAKETISFSQQNFQAAYYKGSDMARKGVLVFTDSWNEAVLVKMGDKASVADFERSFNECQRAMVAKVQVRKPPSSNNEGKFYPGTWFIPVDKIERITEGWGNDRNKTLEIEWRIKQNDRVEKITIEISAKTENAKRLVQKWKQYQHCPCLD